MAKRRWQQEVKSRRKIHKLIPGSRRVLCGKKYTGGIAGSGGAAVADENWKYTTCEICLTHKKH